MLIYHNLGSGSGSGSASNSFNCTKNKNAKNKKKNYKSVTNLKSEIICTKVLEQEGRKKKARKKLLKKNVKFLKGIGLKVKH